MKASAKRGAVLFFVCVIGSALATQAPFWALISQDDSEKWPAVAFAPVGILYMLLAYPVWNGRRSNGAESVWQRDMEIMTLMVGLYALAPAGIALMGVASYYDGVWGNALTVSVVFVCSVWWLLTIYLFVRSDDVRRFVRFRQAVHRIKRIAKTEAAKKLGRDWRAAWHAGTLGDGIAVTLPPLPPEDNNGQFQLGETRRSTWRKHWWEVTLGVALVCEARAFRFYGYQRHFPLCYYGGNWGYWLQEKMGIGQAQAISRAATHIVPKCGRSNPWSLYTPQPANYHLRVISEFGESHWLLAIWRVDLDCGIIWFRLDVPEFPESGQPLPEYLQRMEALRTRG